MKERKNTVSYKAEKQTDNKQHLLVSSYSSEI